MSDTELGTCDFCGDRYQRVAVSEQAKESGARICAACVAWAGEQLSLKVGVKEVRGPQPKKGVGDGDCS